MTTNPILQELALRLETIRLQSLNAHLSPTFDPGVPGVHVQGQFALTGQNIGLSNVTSPDGVAANRVIFITKFEFKYFTIPTATPLLIQDLVKQNLVATIEAEIASTYITMTSPDMERLNTWGIRNAVLHQWPYWREVCHTTSQRLGLPAVLMPLWMPPTVEEIDSSDATIAAEQPAKAKSKRAPKKQAKDPAK
jgi:hypothetical protein